VLHCGLEYSLKEKINPCFLHNRGGIFFCNMFKIGLFGRGKLGQQIIRLSSDYSCEIVEIEKAQILIDATSRECTIVHIQKAMELNLPIIVATTGWYDQLNEAKKLVESHDGFCLYSPNFSSLVQKMIRLAPHFQSQGLKVSVLEKHHSKKRIPPLEPLYK